MPMLPESGNPRVDSWRDRLKDELRTRLEQEMARRAGSSLRPMNTRTSLSLRFNPGASVAGLPADFEMAPPPIGKPQPATALDVAGGPSGDTQSSDYGRAVGVGTVGLVSGLASLIELSGAVDPGKLTVPLNEYAAGIVNNMTPSARENLSRKWMSMDKESVFRNPKAALIQLATQVPQLGISIGSGIGGAGLAVRAAGGAKVLGKAAASRIATTGAGAAGALTEGVMTGGDAANTVISEIMQLDATPEQKKKLVDEYRESGSVERTALFAAAMGAGPAMLYNKLFGKYATRKGIAATAGLGANLAARARSMGTTGLAEGLTEAPQEGYQAYEENISARGYDPTRDPMQDVGERTVAGGFLGMGMGGMAGGIASPVDPDSLAALRARDTRRPPAVEAPPSVEAPPAGAPPGAPLSRRDRMWRAYQATTEIPPGQMELGLPPGAGGEPPGGGGIPGQLSLPGMPPGGPAPTSPVDMRQGELDFSQGDQLPLRFREQPIEQIDVRQPGQIASAFMHLFTGRANAVRVPVEQSEEGLLNLRQNLDNLFIRLGRQGANVDRIMRDISYTTDDTGAFVFRYRQPDDEGGEGPPPGAPPGAPPEPPSSRGIRHRMDKIRDKLTRTEPGSPAAARLQNELDLLENSVAMGRGEPTEALPTSEFYAKDQGVWATPPEVLSKGEPNIGGQEQRTAFTGRPGPIPEGAPQQRELFTPLEPGLAAVPSAVETRREVGQRAEPPTQHDLLADLEETDYLYLGRGAKGIKPRTEEEKQARQERRDQEITTRKARRKEEYKAGAAERAAAWAKAGLTAEQIAEAERAGEIRAEALESENPDDLLSPENKAKREQAAQARRTEELGEKYRERRKFGKRRLKRRTDESSRPKIRPKVQGLSYEQRSEQARKLMGLRNQRGTVVTDEEVPAEPTERRAQPEERAYDKNQLSLALGDIRNEIDTLQRLVNKDKRQALMRAKRQLAQDEADLRRLIKLGQQEGTSTARVVEEVVSRGTPADRLMRRFTKLMARIVKNDPTAEYVYYGMEQENRKFARNRRKIGELLSMYWDDAGTAEEVIPEIEKLLVKRKLGRKGAAPTLEDFVNRWEAELRNIEEAGTFKQPPVSPHRTREELKARQAARQAEAAQKAEKKGFGPSPAAKEKSAAQQSVEQRFLKLLATMPSNSFSKRLLRQIQRGKESWDHALAEGAAHDIAADLVRVRNNIPLNDANRLVNEHQHYRKVGGPISSLAGMPDLIEDIDALLDDAEIVLAEASEMRTQEQALIEEQEREAEAERAGQFATDEEEEVLDLEPSEGEETPGVDLRTERDRDAGQPEVEVEEEETDTTERKPGKPANRLRRGKKYATATPKKSAKPSEAEKPSKPGKAGKRTGKPAGEPDTGVTPAELSSLVQAGSEPAGTHGTARAKGEPREHPGVERITKIKADTPRVVSANDFPNAINLPDVHQFDAANMIVHRMNTNPEGSVTLLADDPGMGKTMEQVMVVLEALKKGPVLLVTRNTESMRSMFFKELKNLGRPLTDFRNLYFTTYAAIGRKAEGKPPVIQRMFFGPSRKQTQPYVNAPVPEGGFYLIVTDEAHALKKPTVADERKTTARFLEVPTKHVLYATATPADDYKAMQLVSHVLGIDFLTLLDRIGLESTGVSQVGDYIVAIKNGWTVQKVHLALAQLLKGAMDSYAYIKGFLHVAFDENVIDLDMPSIVKDPVNQRWVALERRMKGRITPATRSDVRNQAVIQSTYLSENMKVPTVLRMIKEKLAKPGEQVVVFGAKYEENALKEGGLIGELGMSGETIPSALSLLSKALDEAGIKHVKFWGTEREETQEADRARFQSGEIRVFLGTFSKAGEGIDLDDQIGGRPRTLIMLSPPWSWAAQLQAIRRVARAKTMSVPTIVYPTTDTMGDQARMNALARKEDIYETVAHPPRTIDTKGFGDRDYAGVVRAKTTGNSVMLRIYTGHVRMRYRMGEFLRQEQKAGKIAANGDRAVAFSSTSDQWAIAKSEWPRIDAKLKSIYAEEAGHTVELEKGPVAESAAPAPKKGEVLRRGTKHKEAAVIPAEVPPAAKPIAERRANIGTEDAEMRGFASPDTTVKMTLKSPVGGYSTVWFGKLIDGTDGVSVDDPVYGFSTFTVKDAPPSVVQALIAAAEQSVKRAAVKELYVNGYDSHQELFEALVNAFGDYGFVEGLINTGRIFPASIEQVSRITGQDESETVAFYHSPTKTTYLIPENISRDMSDAELRGLFRHEIGIHALHAGYEGKVWLGILNDVQRLAKKQDPVVAEAERNARHSVKLGRVPIGSNAHWEEVLGYITQHHPDSTLARRVITYFKMQLRKIFGSRIPLGVGDLNVLAENALRSAPRTLASKSVAGTEMLRSIQAAIATYARPVPTMRNIATDVAAFVRRRIALPALTRAQQESIYGRYMEGAEGMPVGVRNHLENHNVFIGQKAAYVSRYMELGKELLRDWSDLASEWGRELTEQVHDHFMNTTMDSVWPDRPFDDPGGENHHLVYYNTKDPDTNEWEKRSQEEIDNNRARWEADRREHTRLHEATNGESSRLFRTLTKFYSDEWDHIVRQIVRNIIKRHAPVETLVTGAVGPAGHQLEFHPLSDSRIEEIADILMREMNGEDVTAIKPRMDILNRTGDRPDAKLSQEFMDDLKTVRKRHKLEGPYIAARRFGDYVLEAKKDRKTLSVDNESLELDAIVADQYDRWEDRKGLGPRASWSPQTRYAFNEELRSEIVKALRRNLRAQMKAARSKDNKVKFDDIDVHVDESNLETGQHFATVDQYNYLFMLYENQSERDADMKDLREQGWTANPGLLQQYTANLTREGSSLRLHILDKLPESDDKIHSQLRAAITSAMLDMIAETSIRRAELPRKKRRGYSLDLLRGFAEHERSTAFYSSELEYGNDIIESLDEMKKYAQAVQDAPMDAYSDAEKMAIAEVVSEQYKMHKLNAEPYNPSAVIQAGANLGFLWFLTSPSFWMLQLTQPWTFGLPKLFSLNDQARTGRSATSYLLAGINAMRHPTLRRAKKVGFGFGWARGQRVDPEMFDFLKSSGGFKDLNKQSLLTDEIRDSILSSNLSYKDGVIQMMEKLGEQNLLTMAAHTDLESAARGGDPHGGFIMQWGRVMPQLSEVFGRSAVAIAAYEMQRDAGATHDEATQKAADTVRDSMFDYSIHNRSRLMSGKLPVWGPLSRLTLMFMTHAQHVYALLLRETYRVFKGRTREERMQALRLLSGVFGSHFLAAGALGATFEPIRWAFSGLLALAQALFGAEEPDEPWEDWLERNLVETFGPAVGGALAKGLPYQLLGADIHGRLSLSSLLEYPSRYQTPEGRQGFALRVLNALGPLGSIGGNMAEAAKHASEGDLLRALETTTPKMLRDFTKAYRISTEGVLDTSGNLSRREEAGLWEGLMTGVGVRSAVEERSATRKAVINRIQTERKDTRAEIMEKYKRLMREGRRGDAVLLRAEYNRTAPRDYRITQGDLLRMRTERHKRERQVRQQGVYLPKRDRDLMKYVKYLED